MKRALINKKQREEQEAIGAIYKQYIDTFQESPNMIGKTFVKSDTLYADQMTQSSTKGQLYNPKPVIKLKKDVQIKAPCVASSKNAKKSNLKALGDELKMLQYERQIKDVKLVVPKEPLVVPCFDNDYANSTNLFVSNLSPKVTETRLIELFGPYGPLASVKIMWPRNEVTTKANCGFVAFMSRADAERAMNGLKNCEEMRINWGKCVKIPSHPIYIPPELYKLYSPPPPSGLPFNAQTKHNELVNAVIKVTIPFDRNLLMTIHRTIEFVVREGPQFEAVLMNMEQQNPDYFFLADFKDPAHTYYRWKLYSILNGDAKNAWRMKPFRMYKNGSIWVPPTSPNYKNGMPLELINKKEKLTDSQASKLIHLIRNLTISRRNIADVMAFCVSQPSLDEVLQIIFESLTNQITHPVRKLARLYLLSDVIFNSKKRLECSEIFREIFQQFNVIYTSLKYSQDRDCLKTKICMVLRSWLFHRFFDMKFVTSLENLFLYGNEQGEEDDGELLDEPLDGASLLKRSRGSLECFDMFKV